MKNMKTRYRLTSRGSRGGMFYCVDKTTGQRASLHTTNEDEARQLVEAKNNSERQPVLKLKQNFTNPMMLAFNLRVHD
jgi:hypothetical protein